VFGAQEAPVTSEFSTTSSFAKIMTGNLSISTNKIAFGFGQYGNFSISPNVEYFIADRVALGATFGFSTGSISSSTSLLFGPSVTYHFIDYKKASAYVGASYVVADLVRGIDQVNFDTNGMTFHLGMNYNFTPSFGMGPRLKYANAEKEFSFSILNLFVYL
jgi:hypothetical protein